MEERTLDEALALVEMRRTYDLTAQIIQEPCPRCGARLVCAYADRGAGYNRHHHYAHVCLSTACDYHQLDREYESTDWGELPATCPRCGRYLSSDDLNRPPHPGGSV